MDDAEWLFTNALGTAMQRAGPRHICKGLGQFRPHLSPLVHSNEGGGVRYFYQGSCHFQLKSSWI